MTCTWFINGTEVQFIEITAFSMEYSLVAQIKIAHFMLAPTTSVGHMFTEEMAMAAGKTVKHCQLHLTYKIHFGQREH